jgi:hypothetical protein
MELKPWVNGKFSPLSHPLVVRITRGDKLGEELIMKPRHTLALLTLTATLVCVGCSSSAIDPSTTNPSNPPAQESPPASSPSAGSKLPAGADPVKIDPADFTADITNPYWPMKPGTRWIYSGVEAGSAPQDIVIVVTTATKKLANGVTARVVRDTARSKGEIIEDTIDWYAQDSEGNVWYMGENTAEFEEGKIVSRVGSWEAGVEGALPGIMLPGQPQVGQKYRQEYKKGEAEDNGEVLATTHRVEVEAKSSTQALVTMDTSTIEPDVVEHKFYGKGVGPLLALDISGGAGREELVKMDKTGPKAGTGPLGKPNP